MVENMVEVLEIMLLMIANIMRKNADNRIAFQDIDDLVSSYEMPTS